MRRRVLETWPIHEAKARISELVKRAQQPPSSSPSTVNLVPWCTSLQPISGSSTRDVEI